MPSVYGDDRPLMRLPPVDAIPHVLHVLWKSRSVPRSSLHNLRRWTQLHPAWRVYLWTDADLERLLATVLKGSPHLGVWRRLAKHIMRVDMARYVLLHQFGGVYADLDVLPERPLDALLRHHSCVVAREPEAYTVAIAMTSTVLASNFLMASRPGHPFWLYLIDKIKGRKGIILNLTGPFALTEVLRQYKADFPVTARSAAVFVAPSLYFDPPISEKGDALHIHMIRKSACAHLRKHKSMTKFSTRICDTASRQGRLDWSDSYRQPRFFNGSFTRHFMMSSYTKAVGQHVSVDKEGLLLLNPQRLIKLVPVPDIYETDKKVQDGKL